MTSPIERLNGWAKVLLLFIPLAVAGLIAWGGLRSDMNHVEAEEASHASRETVDAQYQAILRELQTINARLQRLEAK